MQFVHFAVCSAHLRNAMSYSVGREEPVMDAADLLQESVSTLLHVGEAG